MSTLARSPRPGASRSALSSAETRSALGPWRAGQDQASLTLSLRPSSGLAAPVPLLLRALGLDQLVLGKAIAVLRRHRDVHSPPGLGVAKTFTGVGIDQDPVAAAEELE